MARPRGRVALQQAKEAKQKKILFVLVPVFLAIVAWQGPKTFKALSGPSAAAPPPATTTTAGPTTPAPTVTGEEPVPSGGGFLTDSDLPVEAGEGQLVGLGRFTGRDPFAGAPSSVSGTDESGSGGSTSDGGSDDEEPGASTAVLEVNGVAETINEGSAFPMSQPVFTLVSLSEERATIGIVQGLFEDGSSTVDIEVGEQVTLVAAPDSTQYRVELIRVY